MTAMLRTALKRRRKKCGTRAALNKYYSSYHINEREKSRAVYIYKFKLPPSSLEYTL